MDWLHWLVAVMVCPSYECDISAGNLPRADHVLRAILTFSAANAVQFVTNSMANSHTHLWHVHWVQWLHRSTSPSSWRGFDAAYAKSIWVRYLRVLVPSAYWDRWYRIVPVPSCTAESIYLLLKSGAEKNHHVLQAWYVCNPEMDTILFGRLDHTRPTWFCRISMIFVKYSIFCDVIYAFSHLLCGYCKSREEWVTWTNNPVSVNIVLVKWNWTCVMRPCINRKC